MKELMLNQLITGLLGLSKFELLDNLVESLHNLSENHSCFVSGLPRLPFPVFRVPHRQSFLSLKINPDNTQTLNCAYELYHQISCNAN